MKPMLGKITTGIADAVSQMNRESFIAEYKYDGVRAQIHVSEGPSSSPSNTFKTTNKESREVKIFSRNLEDRTGSFPDVVAQILAAADGGARSFVLDAEIVAIHRPSEYEIHVSRHDVADGNESRAQRETTDPSEGASSDPSSLRLRSFQELAARPRNVVDASTISVPVCIFVFDAMEIDGRSLLEEPLMDRRAAVRKALPSMQRGLVQLTEGVILDVDATKEARETIDGDDEMRSTIIVSEVTKALHASLAIGAEGLMLKSLRSTYEPSRRSSHWLKLKKDYCEGLVESLDLVVVGAFHGSGRKAGWYSPFLLAVWEAEREQLQSVCRCMSGFSDEFYRKATARLKETVVPKKPLIVDTLETPDVWFEPKEVWEIRGADLTLSPVHRAAIGRVSENPSKGLGLRFPRFLRVREDKNVEDATSALEIIDTYEKQQRGHHRAVKDLHMEDQL